MKISGQTTLIVLVLTGILLVAGGYFAYRWYDGNLSDLNGKLKTALADLNQVEKKVQDLGKIQERLRQAQELQAQYEEMIPGNDEIPQLLRDTYGILASSGVVLQNFTPDREGSQTITAPGLSQIGVAITAQGTYDKLLAMFDTLRSWRRLIGINSFNITTLQEGGLQCQFSIVAFYSNQ